jgi:hypothetical protein
MTKKKKRIDNQLSLFEVIQNFQNDKPAPKPVGSFNIDRAFREAISEALRWSPLSRYQVAARMSELTDTDITKTMLDSWTAESKVQNRFPAVFLSAFCEAVGTMNPLRLLGQPIGAFVLPGPEALRAEIQRIEEEITRKQAEKRRRLTFLKEMEGSR